MTDAPRIGLVLGAGGTVGGAFHSGVLGALAEATGWDPRTAEVIVGTSAGSVTGALLRAGLAPSDLAARALGQPVSTAASAVLRRTVLPAPGAATARPARATLPFRMSAPGALLQAARRPWRVRPGAIAAAVLPVGTVSTEAISGGVGGLFREGWPASTTWVCAVRLDEGRRVVFGREGAPTATVGQAVAASCAIPGWFAPVEIDGVRYVDGGVHSPTNLDVVRDLGLDLVVVSSPMSAAGRAPSLRADQAIRRFARANLDAEALRVRRRGTPVIAFQPTPADLDVMGIDAMDAGRRGAVVEQVKASTLRRLARADVQRRLAPLRGSRPA